MQYKTSKYNLKFRNTALNSNNAIFNKGVGVDLIVDTI